MQLNLYLLKHFFMSSLLVALSLIGVVWLNHALRMLEFIVSKDSTIHDFLLPLSFFPIPLWLVIALPMSAFIGVIWVISRFLSDRELIVMQAVGFTPLQFGRVPIIFGAALTFALLINSVYILPASFSTFKKVQAEVRGSIPKLLIQDNVFIDIADDLTLFVGKRINQNEVGRVFIQDSRNPEVTITFTSERGQFSSVNGQPVFLLLNGQRTELRKDGTSNAQLTFETHSLDISQQNTGAAERVILDMNEDLHPQFAKPRYCDFATLCQRKNGDGACLFRASARLLWRCWPLRYSGSGHHVFSRSYPDRAYFARKTWQARPDSGFRAVTGRCGSDPGDILCTQRNSWHTCSLAIDVFSRSYHVADRCRGYLCSGR